MDYGDQTDTHICHQSLSIHNFMSIFPYGTHRMCVLHITNVNCPFKLLHQVVLYFVGGKQEGLYPFSFSHFVTYTIFRITNFNEYTLLTYSSLIRSSWFDVVNVVYSLRASKPLEKFYFSLKSSINYYLNFVL